jgi:hypothetical protein
MYREMGMTYWLEKAEAEMAELKYIYRRLSPQPRDLTRPSPRAIVARPEPRSARGSAHEMPSVPAGEPLRR